MLRQHFRGLLCLPRLFPSAHSLIAPAQTDSHTESKVFLPLYLPDISLRWERPPVKHGEPRPARACSPSYIVDPAALFGEPARSPGPAPDTRSRAAVGRRGLEHLSSQRRSDTAIPSDGRRSEPAASPRRAFTSSKIAPANSGQVAEHGVARCMLALKEPVCFSTVQLIWRSSCTPGHGSRFRVPFDVPTRVELILMHGNVRRRRPGIHQLKQMQSTRKLASSLGTT